LVLKVTSLRLKVFGARKFSLPSAKSLNHHWTFDWNFTLSLNDSARLELSEKAKKAKENEIADESLCEINFGTCIIYEPHFRREPLSITRNR
jgi:hypothetical protein